MKDSRPKTIYLKDYQQPDYWIDTTHLHFELGDEVTRVTSTLSLRLNKEKNKEASMALPPLVLTGQNVELDGLSVDGQEIDRALWQCDGDQLSIAPPVEQFVTEIITLIRPQDNKSLEGLYLSGGLYCTQCEAEGFRKITYYLDRPDVMSVFTTTISADQARFPVLLSNGNAVSRTTLDEGRHQVTWHDPFKKPSYLFALVAGRLELLEDSFTTVSGRTISLQIFVEPHNIDKCDHAMRSLKKAMTWDEEVYGREYDLDTFMIVAVDDFNMGAMENKGLNIFNSSCILARPDTATDSTFERIESIVAHEYFHNWSGNRVTCRDWFQLSLKEGFTVFRDAEFSADMNSRTVKRAQDVAYLRSHQFAEDAGPMAHPVRPDSFIEISNFYTLTVYEKGSEVVRMIHNIVGKEGFRKGTDLFFERHDGNAVTCDDFVRAMEDANGIELQQFRLWYSQAGTPVLDVTDEYQADRQQYRLTISQSCPPTPGQSDKKPFHIPVGMGLLDSSGSAIALNAEGSTHTVLDLRQQQQTFTFDNVQERPLPSLLRSFSAPVRLNYDYSRAQLAQLICHDEDGFNRWDSSQRLAMDVLLEMVDQAAGGEEMVVAPVLLSTWADLLDNTALDAAMVAEMIRLPSESYIGEQVPTVDVDAIHSARQHLKQVVAEQLYDRLCATYDRLNHDRPYRPVAADVAGRSLKNSVLGYLVEGHEAAPVQWAHQQFTQAGNMTDSLAALQALLYARHPDAVPLAKQSLAQFEQRWKDDTNVMDLWFSVQSGCYRNGLELVQSLMQHSAFNALNPNKMRSLVGAFCNQNQIGFHDASGCGYAFLADEVLRVDSFNPQLASRLITPLTRLKRYGGSRRELMLKALKQIEQQTSLSPDLFEVVKKSLA